MEFLILILLTLSVWLVWKKPEKEKLAFAFFVAGTAICFLMYFVASSNSLLPHMNY